MADASEERIGQSFFQWVSALLADIVFQWELAVEIPHSHQILLLKDVARLAPVEAVGRPQNIKRSLEYIHQKSEIGHAERMVAQNKAKARIKDHFQLMIT